ncbi:hypothetical protein QA646_09885 [Rhizobium sp. CB3090]|uniref:hypothetical protein n=1 Tax=Rhizobium sp. CB3090 TaxID=3039156 RepID=UPI0024B1DEE7|nr:hypothetical protein [Rhizobium sp. CB3090]WFU07641.1 hypothetical protein QA646_09885 [Rhizobium sp. CB3090]
MDVSNRLGAQLHLCAQYLSPKTVSTTFGGNMRRLIFATFMCTISSIAVAGDDQKLEELTTAFINASYASLSAAYFCRDGIGVDSYLKVRKAVEAGLVNITGNADVARKIMDEWEKKMARDPLYKNPKVTVDKCSDLLMERYHKLDAAFDAIANRQNTH